MGRGRRGSSSIPNCSLPPVLARPREFGHVRALRGPGRGDPPGGQGEGVAVGRAPAPPAVGGQAGPAPTPLPPSATRRCRTRRKPDASADRARRFPSTGRGRLAGRGRPAAISRRACALRRGRALQLPAAPARRRAGVTSSGDRESAGAGPGTDPGRHDQAGAVAVRTRPAGLGLGRAGAGAAGAVAARPVPAGPAAPARLLAGGLRLLLPGHRGLPPGHLQRLRGGGCRAAGAHQCGAGGPAPAGAALLTPVKARDGGRRWCTGLLGPPAGAPLGAAALVGGHRQPGTLGRCWKPRRWV